MAVTESRSVDRVVASSVPVLLLVGCGSSATEAPADIEMLAPIAGEITGWTPQGDPQVFAGGERSSTSSSTAAPSATAWAL
jgi:hypothetical protein